MAVKMAANMYATTYKVYLHAVSHRINKSIKINTSNAHADNKLMNNIRLEIQHKEMQKYKKASRPTLST